MRPTWERFARFGPLVLMAIIVLPHLAEMDSILTWPIEQVAHRLLYRREDRANPEIIAFVDWITGMLAEERHSGWR